MKAAITASAPAATTSITANATRLAAGPIMSLPNRVLVPQTRAVGMGIFYTLFYLVVVLAPWIGGRAAAVAGSARITFDLGTGMLLVGCAACWLFQRLADRAAKAHARVVATGGLQPL